MTFQPVVPFGGYAGWRFLGRTMHTQQKAFVKTPAIQRDLDYFRQNIAKVTTAEALVTDRRLLSVALGAFGLDSDINNRFFIRKVLEDGTVESAALGKRLANKSYLKLSKAFGFGDFSVPNTRLSDFADQIISAYQDRQFEIAVGNQDDSMRLALNFTREIGEIAESTASANTKWYTVMGSAPMRKVFETALGLPSSFASLDIDKQLGIFRSRAERAFGNGEIAQFTDPARQEDVIRLFLLRSEVAAGSAAYSPAATALTLLQNRS